MAWTDLEFDFGSILTSSKMTNLQANFQAMADGDSGAPIINYAALSPGIMTGGVVGPYSRSGSTAYGEQFTLYFYHDGTANNIYFRYEISTTSTSATCKVNVNATDDEQSTSSTTYIEKTGSIDLTGLSSGWVPVVVSLKIASASSGWTGYLKEFYWYAN